MSLYGKKVDIETLRRLAAMGLTRREIAKRLDCSFITVRIKCAEYDIPLVDSYDSRRNGFGNGHAISKNRSPMPSLLSSPLPSPETAITPSLRRLAKHDSIAARALARKEGRVWDEEDSAHPPELP